MTTIKSNIASFDDIIDGYDPSKNTTPNVMTRFERCKVVGMRMTQISLGALPCVDTKGLNTIAQIVQKELTEHKIPYIIKRPLPNGKMEYWRVKDMVDRDNFDWYD